MVYDGVDSSASRRNYPRSDRYCCSDPYRCADTYTRTCCHSHGSANRYYGNDSHTSVDSINGDSGANLYCYTYSYSCSDPNVNCYSCASTNGDADSDSDSDSDSHASPNTYAGTTGRENRIYFI